MLKIGKFRVNIYELLVGVFSALVAGLSFFRIFQGEVSGGAGMTLLTVVTTVALALMAVWCFWMAVYRVH